MQKNHFLLLKKLKNTEIAHLCYWPYRKGNCCQFVDYEGKQEQKCQLFEWGSMIGRMHQQKNCLKNLILHQSYWKSSLPAKSTWSEMLKISFLSLKKAEVGTSGIF